MSLSTLRARLPLPSLASLTDDSLLVIFRHLPLHQLWVLLSASRRVNCLIVQHILSRYRTIQIADVRFLDQNAQYLIFFYLNFHEYTVFDQSRNDPYIDTLRYIPYDEPSNAHRHRYRSVLSSFPLHLPQLFPRMQSFDFAYFLHEDGILSGEEVAVNRRLIGYLASGWSETLVSLKLWLIMDTPPQPGEQPLFGPLNQLVALRHLFIGFASLYRDLTQELTISLIPDSMPVLGRLVSFSLHTYNGANVVTLLRQLSPNLTFLSLLGVACSGQDFIAFLRSKPSYKQSIRTLDIYLYREEINYRSTPQLSALAEHFLSLEILRIGLFSLLADNPDGIFPFFRSLSRFSRLQEFGFFTLAIHELRTLRDRYSRLSLPRLTSLRRVCFEIYFSGPENDFPPSELFNGHLPLLGGIFCAIEQIEIRFVHKQASDVVCPTLSEQLLSSMKEHFPTARTCQGIYWPRRQAEDRPAL